MGFLGFGKKPRVLDLGESYRKNQNKIDDIRSEQVSEDRVLGAPEEKAPATPFGFFFRCWF